MIRKNGYQDGLGKGKSPILKRNFFLYNSYSFMNTFQKRIMIIESILILGLFVLYISNYLSFNILLIISLLYLFCFMGWFYFKNYESKDKQL